MKKINREENLDEIFELTKEICKKQDLRFGQLMEVMSAQIDYSDLFYVENNKILNWLKEKQQKGF